MQPSYHQLVQCTNAIIEYLDTHVDPEFDNEYEELEREFQELRLKCNFD